MGIDIYARWKGMTEKEKEAQSTGFDIYAGHTGYLREAYHGEPYATKDFVKEAFESESHKAKISAKKLLKRLPAAMAKAGLREMQIYKTENPFEIWLAQKSYVDFCELCKAKEEETGEPCEITASF